MRNGIWDCNPRKNPDKKKPPRIRNRTQRLQFFRSFLGVGALNHFIRLKTVGVNHWANLLYLRGNQNWKLVYKPMKREFSSHLPSLVISLLGVTPTIQITLLSMAMLFFSLAKIHNRKHLSHPAPWAKITVNKCRLFSIFRIQHLW